MYFSLMCGAFVVFVKNTCLSRKLGGKMTKIQKSWLASNTDGHRFFVVVIFFLKSGESSIPLCMCV